MSRTGCILGGGLSCLTSLKSDLFAANFQLLVDALGGLGHVGDGHCQERLASN